MTNSEALKAVKIEIEELLKTVDSLNDQLTQSNARLADLRVTERVLSGMAGGSQPTSNEEGSVESTGTISDEILRVLRTKGPQAKADLLEHLERLRGEISATTVATTLSRMKERKKVDNRNGKWQVA